MKFDKKAAVIFGVVGALAGGLSGVLRNSMNLPLAVTIVVLAIFCGIVGTVIYIIWK